MSIPLCSTCLVLSVYQRSFIDRYPCGQKRVPVFTNSKRTKVCGLEMAGRGNLELFPIAKVLINAFLIRLIVLLVSYSMGFWFVLTRVDWGWCDFKKVDICQRSLWSSLWHFILPIFKTGMLLLSKCRDLLLLILLNLEILLFTSLIIEGLWFNHCFGVLEVWIFSNLQISLAVCTLFWDSIGTWRSLSPCVLIWTPILNARFLSRWRALLHRSAFALSL